LKVGSNDIVQEVELVVSDQVGTLIVAATFAPKITQEEELVDSEYVEYVQLEDMEASEYVSCMQSLEVEVSAYVPYMQLVEPEESVYTGYTQLEEDSVISQSLKVQLVTVGIRS
jgi:hypothetical protein